MSVSSPTNTSFAVLGSSGSLSPYVINALSKQPGVKKVIVLSRPSSSAPFLPSNVELVRADYGNHSALVELFKKHSIDVVISTLSDSAVMDAQKKLALAAKEAGVKLFVPVEYGFVTIGFAEKGGPKVWANKDEFAAFLKSIDLPYARVFTGLWNNFTGWLVGYNHNQKVNIVGKGETLASFTAEEDVGGFIAHVTTTFPMPRLAWANFRLEGDRLTLRQIAERFNKPIEFVDSTPEPMAEHRNLLQKAIETGAGSTGWDPVKEKENPPDSDDGAGSANKLWEGHVWKKVDSLEIEVSL
ncbi:NAD(P)-binding protein [Dendrothele bispora CBS 962.96]|uniref:NAD(P)-binding protein n=1 Tax=Dendrothele bispora (strain CBS 962.96) TaxID=1314807 RepID=A0A4S8MHU8_DENBC|nr:NAD(P)-binding protein [Dendrothele bispora CBS 962.96]